MKSILLSIKPKYVELIASGKKTIEVRNKNNKEQNRQNG
jgi:ASC-1-like (ASCH) protein